MPQSEILEMAAEVVAAFISNNPLPKGELPALIQTISKIFWRGSPAEWRMPARSRNFRASGSADPQIDHAGIFDLPGGRQKVQVAETALGDPWPDAGSIRAKWKLPADYPVVAPDYAATRSALAKAIGLGQSGGRGGAHKRGRPPKAVQA